MTMLKQSSRTDKVAASTTTYTTHVVHVDLAVLLAGYDLTDNVVLMISTPSGRDKRVVLPSNFLVAPHHMPDYEYRS
jgi:hypothetical protein